MSTIEFYAGIMPYDKNQIMHWTVDIGQAGDLLEETWKQIAEFAYERASLELVAQWLETATKHTNMQCVSRKSEFLHKVGHLMEITVVDTEVANVFTLSAFNGYTLYSALQEFREAIKYIPAMSKADIVKFFTERWVEIHYREQRNIGEVHTTYKGCAAICTIPVDIPTLAIKHNAYAYEHSALVQAKHATCTFVLYQW